ncbi:endonuclease domain-containing protein [Microlunatus sp. GCM10028923]|uniref:endonuclease domain-containing protein n=1 Tax=Microlunatus sp. GCM10028923 TaxID=3273400 RepID=UPI0036226C58
MKAAREIQQALRDGGGVIRIRDHPGSARAIQRLAKSAAIKALLPGIYCAAEDATDVDVRIRAAAQWVPGCVITGPAAARLTFWPEVQVPIVTLAWRHRLRARPGYRVSRERLPAELVRDLGGTLVTVPALTALDLVPWAGARGLDEALRRKAATLGELREALRLTSGRVGNQLRRAVLHGSRREPWSVAERLLHDILHDAGLRGWAGNVTIRCAGQSYPVDVVFRHRRVIIEVDGYAFHRAENRDQFHRDRRKWTELTAAGWTVLHFTWDHLVYEPAWVLGTVRRALSRKSPAVG